MEVFDEKNYNTCECCGEESEYDSPMWYGEYDGQKICYNCYDKY